ncbi:MAG TPA: lipid A biosynthesis acyltransferase [Roseateles sp.]|nr:lipid A biosynthesis acyltransferase [Roseateles sp.]HWT54107.1 lipid A biosynthesis acyltransferase [Rhodocyclaceae bacterium]
MTRIAIFLLWLLHWLPLPVLAPLGRGFGRLLPILIPKRRHIVRTNLRLCFPEMSEAQREALAREHFALLGRSLLERSLLWWASERRLRRLSRVEGLHNMSPDGERLGKQPLILLVPHFLGLDISGTTLALFMDSVSMYSKQKNAAVDALLYHGRSRFGDQRLLTRQDGIRGTIKSLREGRPFFYLPDMDYGPDDAVFVPFFGVPAATITGLSRLAKLGGARIFPVITEILPGGQGYVTRVGEAWQNFPSDDAEADTRRMNAFIEDEIRKLPAQYYWVHKRFKTRPPGEAGFY